MKSTHMIISLTLPNSTNKEWRTNCSTLSLSGLESSMGWSRHSSSLSLHSSYSRSLASTLRMDPLILSGPQAWLCLEQSSISLISKYYLLVILTMFLVFSLLYFQLSFIIWIILPLVQLFLVLTSMLLSIWWFPLLRYISWSFSKYLQPQLLKWPISGTNNTKK